MPRGAGEAEAAQRRAEADAAKPESASVRGGACEAARRPRGGGRVGPEVELEAAEGGVVQCRRGLEAEGPLEVTEGW